MLNLRHISLAAVFVLTTGMTGCNDNTNTTVAKSNAPAEANLPTETVDRAVATIKAYVADSTRIALTVEDYTNAGITGVNATNVATVNDALKTLALQSYPKARAKIQAIVTPGDTTPGDTELGAAATKMAMSVIATYALDNTKTAPTPTDYTNAGIRGVTATNVASVNAQLDNLVSLFTDDVVTKVQAVVDTIEILKKIGNEHQDHNATITVAQLQAITPPLNDINSSYENIYRTYIASADSNISSPATVDEVQSMIDEVNALNLPTNAILDRSFFKKTNGVFQHKFVYLPVTNPKTGRTWLNNNLGAEYSNVDSSDYNASQQATASNDYLAYGSLFQWGRKADGHELIDWNEDGTTGEPLYGKTTTKADKPSDSLFITSNGDWRVTSAADWRVTPDDTLWASESSPNSVCPVGYRLPLNPNGASDSENEWYVEMSTWNSQDNAGSMSSNLKLSNAGGRWFDDASLYVVERYGNYGTGSVSRSNALDMYFGTSLNYNDISPRAYAISVRCIKEQTPAERSASILLEIGNEHRNHKSTVTVAQLKAITPALENINSNYENIYQTYIAGSDTNISSPATIAQLQSMIDEVNALNLPTNAILDRNFFTTTNGAFEHRFVYFPVTNPNTGRTWLNNNLGADYANIDSSAYNPSQQATTSNDYRAYGSMFQWGRKADGHELLKWIDPDTVSGLYGTMPIQYAEDNRYYLYVTGFDEWRVTSDDTLWASESSPNNVCPIGYRLPQNPNRIKDGENEFFVESETWSAQNTGGAIASVLRLPASGFRKIDGGFSLGAGNYWEAAAVPQKSQAFEFAFNWGQVYNYSDNTARAEAYSVRCIKDQTSAERSDNNLKEIGNQHNSGKSTITIAQLKAITPALKNINDDYQDSYRSYIASADSNFSSPATRDEVQSMIDEVNRLVHASDATLADIATQHSSHKSTLTVAQLKAITPALENINDDYENIYRTYIASADTNIGSPATIEELQSMIDEVNSFNLPEHAILDRSFFKKTNGAFEHRFVYLPVTNPNTGRTWLNNNLGAEYANVDSSAYNASYQATAIDDHLAYGSLFQWGRGADGHELINWISNTDGEGKYTTTTIKFDTPSDSLFITADDWRVNRDDTLWASKSSANNVCPTGYRLPLNPHGAEDSANDFYVESKTWGSQDNAGALSSELKLTAAGLRWVRGGMGYIGKEGMYWTGSIENAQYARDLWFGSNFVKANDFINSYRGRGFSVRCIKDQTPAERSESILLVIGNQHNSGKSAITIAQLKAITPALKNINDKYESSYRHYIVSTSTHFSSPATRDEVQSMIDTANLSLSHLTKLGSYDTAGESRDVTLSSDGSKAYVADDANGLVIVDISDPYNPTKLSSYNTAGNAKAVALSSDGTKAYVADYSNGLVIVDISNPAHPTKLGSCDTAGELFDVTLSSDGTKAYVADYWNGLVIIDISDPAHPTKLGSYDTAGGANGVTLSSDGTKAYVADFTYGLVIVNISNPAHPTMLSSYNIPGNGYKVTLSGDGTKAYIAAGTKGLVIVDIRDPYNPIKLGSYNTDEYALDVTLSSDSTKAYVADYYKGLVIVDISSSTHPRKIESFDTAGDSWGVTLSSDNSNVYIADRDHGLIILGGLK